MKGRSLSRRIGLVVTLITLVFMGLFFFESARRIYHQHLSKHLNELEELAHRLDQDISVYLFNIHEIENRENIHQKHRFMELHTLLQPLVEEYGEEGGFTSLGYYSKELEAIVAITPLMELENLLGFRIEEDHPSTSLYTDRPMQREISHVLRGKVARYAKLVFYRGEPIGHIWANLPVSVLYQKLFPSFILFLFLVLLGIGFGKFLSSYISKKILQATEMLEAHMDALRYGERDHSTSTGTSYEDLPLEFHPLFKRFYSSIEKIKDLTVELTVSTRLAALGDLVTVVAHDIRNPLSLILAKAQLGLQKSNDMREKKYFEGIIEASKIIDGFLERILLLAKFDTCNKRYFSIAHVLQELLDLWAPLMRQKEIQLNIMISDDLPEVMGDLVGFQQAFLNLFKNAIEATSTGGSITVQVEERENGICIRISDTGDGIPEEAQREIFRRFFTTKEDNGSGIGLAMAHSVITGQGGRIWFETREGEGTTFFILFPLGSIPVDETTREVLWVE